MFQVGCWFYLLVPAVWAKAWTEYRMERLWLVSISVHPELDPSPTDA